MSDEHPHAPKSAEVSKPLAPVIDLRAARYVKLLFGEGEEGWLEGSMGAGTMDAVSDAVRDVFVRHAIAPEDKPFKLEDFDACIKLLDDEYGIELDPLNPQQCHFTPSEMIFIISDDDMACLRDDGLAPHNAGKLVAPRHARLNKMTQQGAPDFLLAAQMRAHLMRAEEWYHVTGLLGIDASDLCASLLLPNDFLDDLAREHGVDSLTSGQVTELVKAAWRAAFPDGPIPDIGSRPTPRGTVYSFVVHEQQIPKLEEEWQKAKNPPDTQISSIASEKMQDVRITGPRPR